MRSRRGSIRLCKPASPMQFLHSVFRGFGSLCNVSCKTDRRFVGNDKAVSPGEGAAHTQQTNASANPGLALSAAETATSPASGRGDECGSQTSPALQIVGHFSQDFGDHFKPAVHFFLRDIQCGQQSDHSILRRVNQHAAFHALCNCRGGWNC